jgi:hypothetical protein
MSKFIVRLGGVAAAAALVLSIGVGSASANVTRYHESDGTVVSITAPGTVSATVGSVTHFPVTVSVLGPTPLKIANEKFLTAYGWGDSQWDGLSFANYGCWGRTLYSGQSCTSTVAFSPTFVGTHSEAYMLGGSAGTWSTLYANFTATGYRQPIIWPVTSGGTLLSP